MRVLGPGLIWAYGPEAPATRVGTTGGGPDIPGSPQMPSLSCDELARDLRLARHWCDQILIHSLEGCIWHGHLRRLRSFDWTDTAPAPDHALAAKGLRVLLRMGLRASAHPWRTMSITSASCCAFMLLAHRGHPLRPGDSGKRERLCDGFLAAAAIPDERTAGQGSANLIAAAIGGRREPAAASGTGFRIPATATSLKSALQRKVVARSRSGRVVNARSAARCGRPERSVRWLAGVYRTTSTGLSARWMTLWAVLPTSSPLRSPRPREPITMTPASCALASPMISRAA
jgi:hypothetical protein